jgi:hypothetical protein
MGRYDPTIVRQPPSKCHWPWTSMSMTAMGLFTHVRLPLSNGLPMATSQPAASRKLRTMSCMSRRGPIYRERRTSEWVSLNSLATTVGGMASTHRRETISKSVNSDCRPIDPGRSSKWGQTSSFAKWSLGSNCQRQKDVQILAMTTNASQSRCQHDIFHAALPCVIRYLESMGSARHLQTRHKDFKPDNDGFYRAEFVELGGSSFFDG